MSLLAAIARDDLADTPLVEIWRVIDWRPIDMELEPFHVDLDLRRGGPTPFTPASMFRASLLQDWYRLSFQETARALRIRLDFAVFAGLEPGLRFPSASTLCRARLRLEKEGVRARCYQIVIGQLEAIGMKVMPIEGALRDIRLQKT